MFHFFTPRIRSIYITTCSLLLCLLVLSPIVAVSAEEMPDKDQLTQQITQQAAQEVAEGFSGSNNQPAQQTEVVNTGNNPSVESSSSTESSVAVNNNNSATVTQTTTATANTGGNEASRNISIGGNAGMITTGNAAVNTTAVVQANNNSTTVGTGGSGQGGQGTSVTNTGNGATTASNSNSQTNVIANNKGTATIVQAGNASATTGNNKADRNISIGGNAGLITTGNASANMSYLVAANNNKTVAIVGGASTNGPGSGASIYVVNTGDNSYFSSQNSSLLRAQVANNNKATVTQSCGSGYAMSCSANTGGNSANRGIAFGGDAGVINTGNAAVNVTLFAQVNKNSTGVGIGGNGMMGSVLGIVNTGDTTTFNQTNNSETDVSVANNNSATVVQTANAHADTGNNTANRNISFGGDAGVINTGDATVNVVMVADVNSNETAVCVDQPYCPVPGSGPNPTPLPTPSPAPSGTPTPSPNPSASPTPHPSSTPSSTPTPTPGVGGGNNSGTGGSGTTSTNTYYNYYYPTSTSTTTNNHSVGRVLSDFIEAVSNPGQVLAATTTDGCPPCSATAFTSSTPELPAWQRVLKGVLLLSVGYGLATARYKLPKFVGTK